MGCTASPGHSSASSSPRLPKTNSTLIAGSTPNNAKTKRLIDRYVERRAAEIKETTKGATWCWVPADDTVADDATRGVKAADLQRQRRWFKGPQFLTGQTSPWPEQPSKNDVFVEPILMEVESQPEICLPDVTRFSSWMLASRPR